MNELKKTRLRMKAHLAAALFVCFFILLTGAESHSDDKYDSLVEKAVVKKADNLFQEGCGCYKRKEYEAAIAMFREALALHPQHQKSKIYLNKSETALEKVRRARLLNQRREREKEEKLRSKMVQQGKTKQLAYHYLKGREFFKNRKYKEAEEEFNKVLLIDPSHAGAKKLLTEAESKASGREDVETELKENFAFVMSYIEGNEYKDAREKLTHVLSRIKELEDDYKMRSASSDMLKETKIKSNKVMGYLDKEEYAQAKEEIGRLLEKISGLAERDNEIEKNRIDSEKVKTYFNSALDSIDEGNYSQARFELEKILEIDPKNEEAASLLNRIKEIIIISGGD